MKCALHLGDEGYSPAEWALIDKPTGNIGKKMGRRSAAQPATVSDEIIEAENIDFHSTNILTSDSAISQDIRLGFLIHDVSRLKRNNFDQLMKPFNVTRSQWWVIAHAGRHDGMMQTELATLLDVGKVTLGGLIDRLEASGLVERRADASDRRVKRVFLTPAAHELIERMRAAEKKHNREVLKGFSRAERAQLTDMLSRIKANLTEAVYGRSVRVKP